MEKGQAELVELAKQIDEAITTAGTSVSKEVRERAEEILESKLRSDPVLHTRALFYLVEWGRRQSVVFALLARLWGGPGIEEDEDAERLFDDLVRLGTKVESSSRKAYFSAVLKYSKSITGMGSPVTLRAWNKIFETLTPEMSAGFLIAAMKFLISEGPRGGRSTAELKRAVDGSVRGVLERVTEARLWIKALKLAGQLNREGGFVELLCDRFIFGPGIDEQTGRAALGAVNASILNEGPLPGRLASFAADFFAERKFEACEAETSRQMAVLFSDLLSNFRDLAATALAEKPAARFTALFEPIYARLILPGLASEESRVAAYLSLKASNYKNDLHVAATHMLAALFDLEVEQQSDEIEPACKALLLALDPPASQPQFLAALSFVGHNLHHFLHASTHTLDVIRAVVAKAPSVPHVLYLRFIEDSCDAADDLAQLGPTLPAACEAMLDSQDLPSLLCAFHCASVHPDLQSLPQLRAKFPKAFQVLLKSEEIKHSDRLSYVLPTLDAIFEHSWLDSQTLLGCLDLVYEIAMSCEPEMVARVLGSLQIGLESSYVADFPPQAFVHLAQMCVSLGQLASDTPALADKLAKLVFVVLEALQFNVAFHFAKSRVVHEEAFNRLMTGYFTKALTRGKDLSFSHMLVLLVAVFENFVRISAFKQYPELASIVSQDSFIAFSAQPGLLKPFSPNIVEVPFTEPIVEQFSQLFAYVADYIELIVSREEQDIKTFAGVSVVLEHLVFLFPPIYPHIMRLLESVDEDLKYESHDDFALVEVRLSGLISFLCPQLFVAPMELNFFKLDNQFDAYYALITLKYMKAHTNETLLINALQKLVLQEAGSHTDVNQFLKSLLSENQPFESSFENRTWHFLSYFLEEDFGENKQNRLQFREMAKIYDKCLEALCEVAKKELN